MPRSISAAATATVTFADSLVDFTLKIHVYRGKVNSYIKVHVLNLDSLHESTMYQSSVVVTAAQQPVLIDVLDKRQHNAFAEAQLLGIFADDAVQRSYTPAT